jgi:hypothetical protein
MHSVLRFPLGPLFIGNAELLATTNSAGLLLDWTRFLLPKGRLYRLDFEYKTFVFLETALKVHINFGFPLFFREL